MTPLLTSPPTVTISGKEFPYVRRWAGQRLLPVDGYLAFDTETDLVDLKRQIPRLALASASAGEQASCLVHPDDVGKFVLAHKGLHIICHNAAFDFWVIEDHLRRRGEEVARRAWWAIADTNRLHDSMILDMLVRLAKDDSYPDPHDLAVVAKKYAGLDISKTDPYRMRYGEIIGKDWAEVDEGFFAYGVKDAIVTKAAYLAIRKQALALVDEFGRHSNDILPGARQQFGLLTEAVQVKKAIALANITRNGTTVDLAWVRQTECELRQEMLRATAAAQAVCPVYKVTDDGSFVPSGKTNTPAFLDGVMRDELARIKDDIEKETGVSLKIPTTSKGLSRSVKAWSDYAHLHPFLQHWIRAQNMAKLLQFFTPFEDHIDLRDLADALQVGVKDLAAALKVDPDEDGSAAVKVEGLPKVATGKNQNLRQLGVEPERVLAAARALAAAHRQPLCTVHPSYSVMVRTGRTSCSTPNVQQIPKDSAFRQSFVASPGHFLLAVDYSFIELCTFAATALHRYGSSDMANVIKAGIDPHAHTAAMMLGVPADEFMRWKNNETFAEKVTVDGKDVLVSFKEKFAKARQQAKPVNFGVPGGLGVASLVAYAHSTYKVDFTFEEAKERRELLTKTIYKELDEYLTEDGPAVVARNLKAPLWEVRNELSDTHLSSIHKILAGDPKRADGKPYQPTFVSRIWSSLTGLNRNPELKEALEKRQPSPELANRVCHAGVATLTGRIRGRVRYSQARNTPFQGLAADGAALALFELVKEGFRVVGFVHDEILVELPDEGGYVAQEKVRRVKEIMCREMGRVLVGEIPVGCEAALSERWSKKAKLIVKDGKVYPSDAAEAPAPVTPRPAPVEPAIPPAPAAILAPAPAPVTPASPALPLPGPIPLCNTYCPTPLKWFGGKANRHSYLARSILSLAGPHDAYVEPFAGGLSVLLAKPRVAVEVVGDLNADLVNFWLAVRDDCAALLSLLPETFGTEADLAAAFGPASAALAAGGGTPAERAAWFFTANRCSRGGLMEDPYSTGARTRRGKPEAVSSWETARENLPRASARLAGVAICCQPAVDLLRAYDSPRTLCYADPPYMPGTRVAGSYAHEMDDAQHAELLGVLSARNGEVLLSGYPSALYDRLLAGWVRYERAVKVDVGGGARKNGRVECVWRKAEVRS
jgi:DNA adenine methylase